MERLKHRRDFRAAATAVKAAGRAFVVQARRRADEGAVRIGFTVSRQVGNAVERNRVRRRLREMVRLATGKLHAGHDYVLIGRRAALQLPFGEMMREFDAALGKIDFRQRKGTGDAPERLLHDTGSPRQRQKPRRTKGQRLSAE